MFFKRNNARTTIYLGTKKCDKNSGHFKEELLGQKIRNEIF